ncbi:MAG: monovalent cation/H(+) antiporter subunit G [Spirochaetaceae bacterium]
MTWVALAFFALSVVFAIMGHLGVLMFPDVYTRLQASSTATTTSVFSVFLGCMFLTGWTEMTGKIAVIALFFFISSPVAAHIIARFAWRNEMIPWRRSHLHRGEVGRDDD